jgi:hypothetical protein
VIVAGEALAARDLVNIYNNGGTPTVRKANASLGREANGFVMAAVANGANATVFFDGLITGLTGLTAGSAFLSGATAGLATATAPTTVGHIVQRVGTFVTATTMKFSFDVPVTLS